MPSDPRSTLASARRIVVKVGSGVLVEGNHKVRPERVAALARSLSALAVAGRQPVLVTSGAVAAGAPLLGAEGRRKTIPEKQACAAIGQGLLMGLYERAFSTHGRHTAQILLTQDGLRDRERYLNAKNTFETLLEHGIVPIVNENDTVAVEEIKFGDNDQLSAQVAALIGADLLILLSTVDGLYEHPDDAKDPAKRPIPMVDRLGSAHFALAQDSLDAASLSTGGMTSKLKAISKAGQYGVPVVLANGLKEGIIESVLAGEETGTFFLPSADRLSARKHWILHTLKPSGAITVDAGAAKALREQGKSLLPIGIRKVEGDFGIGNAVRVLDPSGVEIARGLANYAARETLTLMGARSEEIESRLGYRYYDEIIHRDNLAIIKD